LAFGRKNTRKNLDENQTTPVSNPKKMLKPKGYLRQTATSVGKVYQPRVTQVNIKIPAEELSLKEKFKQVHSAEASTSKSEVKLETPEVIIPEIKFEIDHTIPISLIDIFTSENKVSISIPTIIGTQRILSLLEVFKSSVYQSFEVFDYLMFSPQFSSPIFSMVGAGGVGSEGAGRQAQPPRIFDLKMKKT
jgi:hypothetical protein